MSLTWQKQLLFTDYSSVGGQERGKKRKIHTDRLIGRVGQQKKEPEKEESKLSHMSVCKPVNLMTGVAGKSVGKSLMASIWNSHALKCYHSPHLSSHPMSSQDRERGVNPVCQC